MDKLRNDVVENHSGEGGDVAFSPADEDVSPARKAARRFMRENPALMRLLAQ